MIGSEFHNTAVYELLWMLVLFGILTLLIRRKPAPGTLMGRVLPVLRRLPRACPTSSGSTTRRCSASPARNGCASRLIPTGIWVLTRVRKVNAADDVAAEAARGRRTAVGTSVRDCGAMS